MTFRSSFGFVALVLGVGGLGCSHEQKEPPAHPAPPPVAAARRVSPPPAPPQEVAQAETPRAGEPSIYFDFDSALLRPESHDVLQKVASSLRASDRSKVRIEGNCDELGTTEYNMALGEERARAAQTYLVHLGVPKGRLQTVSYGSQRPKYTGHDDDAHARNRRDDLIVR